MSVADDMHRRGVGTLMLEHLVSLARSRGVRAFVAETLSENALMMQVFADAGLGGQRALSDGVYEVSFPLPAGEDGAGLATYRDAVAERERSADVVSMRHVLTPASVAVIGASRRPGSVGRAILQNLIDDGFPGPVYAVNPGVAELGAAELGGVPCVPSASALPEPVDLAVIAAPTAAVVGIAEDCGRRGVKALVVTTSGLDRAARAELLGICRRHGMRLVGPTCFGVANTAIPLDATFAAHHPRPGMAGLALQSGGVGIVLLEHLSRLGIGISSFVSLGDKDDVSGNDMLLWWKSDAATKLAVLYLNSFGNPRKFARTARAVARTMPILTVNAGRSAAGRAPGGDARGGSRPAAHPAGAVRAGRRDRHRQLRRAARRRGAAGLPAGARGTAGSAWCPTPAAAGCSPPMPAATRACRSPASPATPGGRCVICSPPHATVAGPVDTTAVVAPGLFRRCLELVGADPGVDAVLALTITTATSDLVSEVRAARLPVPIAVAVMDQVEAVRLLPGPGEYPSAVPAYAYPESAARALGHAARYGRWRAAPPGSVPHLEGLRQDRAAELVASFLARSPEGGWLPQEQTVELFGCYGVPLADSIAVTTEDGVMAAAAQFGGPLAVKADVPGLVRRSDAGGVLLDLHGADEARRAFRSLRKTFGDRLAGVIVQPMITGGVEVKINVLEEQVFGPLVLFGLAGGAADALTDCGRPRTADRIGRRRPAPLRPGRPEPARAPRCPRRRPRLAEEHAAAGFPDGRRSPADRRAGTQSGRRPS